MPSPFPSASPHRLNRAIRMAMLGSLAFSAVVAIRPAQADSVATETAHYQLPAGPLSDALAQLISQSGILFAGSTELAKGRTTQGLEGHYSAQVALETLLEGTGLVVTRAAQGQFLLLEAPTTGHSALELSPLSVSGQGNPVFEAYSTPGPVYHVSREQLDQVPYSRPGDIFNSVPGVAAASSSNGAGLQINIRGLQGMGRVKTLIDGTIQNVSTYKGYPGNREDTYIDPDLIGSIDIKKGPDAGPQGAGVVGGIVSMRTLNASDIITNPEKNWGLRIKGMYGNNVANGDIRYIQVGNESKRTRTVIDPVTGQSTRVQYLRRQDEVYSVKRDGKNYQKIIKNFEDHQLVDERYFYSNASIGGPLPETNHSRSIAAAWRPMESWEITAAHAIRQSGNYYSGSRGKNSWKGLRSDLADTEVYNTSLNSDTYLLKSKLGFLDDHSLELGHIKYRNQSGYFNSNGGFFHDGLFQDPLTEAESSTYTASYSWQPDSPWFDLRANLWKSRLVSDMSFSDTYFADAMDPSLFDRNNLPSVTTDTMGSELWNTSIVSLPLGELSLKYGLSWAQEKAHRSSSVVTFAMAKGQRDTFGAFTQGAWQVTPWLSINGGLQHSRITLESTQLEDTRKEERTFNILDPNYGLVLHPHPNVQLYAQWSKGSRAPTIREDSMLTYNPDLRSEKADNVEYGVNLMFNDVLVEQDRLGIKFSKFKNNYDDYIVRFDRRALGQHISGYMFANIDKAIYEGYELATDYDIGWAFGHFALTYFSKVRYCYPTASSTPVIPKECHAQPSPNDWGGNYVPPRQEKTASLGLRLLGQKLIIGTNMKMSSPSMYGGAFRGSYNGTTVWDRYEIYDLYGSYKATKNLELGFSVENLTDRFYIPSYSSSFEALPAPGRTARGSVTLQF